MPAFRLLGKGKNLWLELPENWLAEHPLTRADLEQEEACLNMAGYTLKLGADV